MAVIKKVLGIRYQSKGEKRSQEPVTARLTGHRSLVTAVIAADERR